MTDRIKEATHKVYKYRVKDKHGPFLRKQAQAVNTVWNFANNTQRHALTWGKKWPTGYDLEKLTVGSSKEVGLHSDIIGKVCLQYVRSRRQHSKPYLRYRGRKNLGWVPLRGRRIKQVEGGISCFGKVFSVWLSRDLPDGAKICDGSNFSQNARGQWFLNIVIETTPAAKRPINKSVGIDLGLKDLAVLSTGERIAAPQHFRRAQDRLAKAQRANKRRQVTKIQGKIAAQRRDHLHKVSTQIVRDYDKIIVGGVSAERLKQTTMAKSVCDAGWTMLRHQLRYKAIAHGAVYVEVSERLTTQICSSCTAVSGPKGIAGLGIRQWACDCGAVHDRDVNAAMNIARLGQQTLAEGIAA